MISLGINPDYRKQTIDQAARGQVVGDDIPMIESVFDLKSGLRAKLVDRSGSMVISKSISTAQIGSNGARSKQGSRQRTGDDRDD